MKDLTALFAGKGWSIAGDSVREQNGAVYLIAEKGGEKKLVIYGNDDRFCGIREGEGEESVLLCDLTHENRLALNAALPYTAPVSLRGADRSIGLGDRLGISTIAHIRALEGTGYFPVLSQQSKRELDLTGRTNPGVMDDVAWQVFEAGYEGGYAADGDHRKTKEEVKEALDEGITMLTLDCSEHIDNKAFNMAADEAKEACLSAFGAERVEEYAARYLEKEFPLPDGDSVYFDKDSFFQMLLTYVEAIAFAEDVFHSLVEDAEQDVSFEVSIDETETTTLPAAHYFVASELLRDGVRVDSMAPRFCGEFQKGIDYIGDLAEFEKEFSEHAAIAEHFGYRISVHSGSDKFSAFPIVGARSKGRFHLKTSGTTWVEAVRVIARCAPDLFRRMAAFSVEHFEECRAYYHVKAEKEDMPDLASIADADLPDLLSMDGPRQIMHITYGPLLKEKDAEGKSVFRDDIYRVLYENKDVFTEVIAGHIRRHIEKLDQSL